ncbi:MAG: hypothetical protein US42_C0005G0065 [Candidatus Magasanikbacteria bacterium GW2011_GWC2_37_14]|uniref:26 kDa periplasmic immunogenic protein n=1 Tax=Candidatus Magasanikbacteria bacterium GW2011_GWC2_37_14 TaxID=1619046 RepID=A0A0G0GNV1_9BACT|nr:MAG: hypothetical protein US42_C0005G0065 [Candidatus Magasanikbacteria bacterium GW2011_GWC2_37_14]
MPVKKIDETLVKGSCCGEGKSCCSLPMGKCCRGNFAHKIMLTLAGILLVYGIVLVGTMIRNNMQQYYFIGKAPKSERLITVEASGKVTVKPDLAVTTMGMMAEAKTVAEAQKKNTEVMNNLLAKLKAVGVDEKDIQTANYNVYPQYDYTDGTSVLKGYQVSQNLTVKIRDLNKADQILGLAGEVGANSVSGIEFTFDDTDVYVAEARDLAMKKIEDKVKMLSQQLGVRFMNVTSYYEYNDQGTAYPKMYAESAMGMGNAVSVPDIQPGTNDISLKVNVTFEIR